MSKANNLTDFLTDTANAIRKKKGTTAKINPQNFASEIEGIKTTPTLQQKTVTPSTSGQSVTPDSGYDGLSKVTVNAAPLQEKTVTPSTSQQSVTPDSGKVGLSKVTVNAISPQLSAQSFTPGTSDQKINKGVWLTGDQTIRGDANLIASNIKNGVSIFGVEGTYTGASHIDILDPGDSIVLGSSCAYFIRGYDTFGVRYEITLNLGSKIFIVGSNETALIIRNGVYTVVVIYDGDSLSDVSAHSVFVSSNKVVMDDDSSAVIRVAEVSIPMGI